jgi:hypothetical protein
MEPTGCSSLLQPQQNADPAGWTAVCVLRRPLPQATRYEAVSVQELLSAPRTTQEGAFGSFSFIGVRHTPALDTAVMCCCCCCWHADVSRVIMWCTPALSHGASGLEVHVTRCHAPLLPAWRY